MFPKTHPIGVPIAWHKKRKTVREEVQDRKFQEKQYQCKQSSVLEVDAKFGPTKVEECPSEMPREEISGIPRQTMMDDLIFNYEQYTDPPGIYDADRVHREVTASPSADLDIEFDGISD
ncbi:hypothetical protein DFQ28_004047 [Apophysomyces sp. BC1034]|nr:hypothetical protein DFQ30_004026 [Apophysomyces sp. BC1015]KAG0178646.1 hypothetical protein DFQ29_003214 [Apophysomyces sp. BC1021]KAG0188969.1 hypothetical protein DFQ28_004047 [Apophysomyces sp. BC1034]